MRAMQLSEGGKNRLADVCLLIALVLSYFTWVYNNAAPPPDSSNTYSSQQPAFLSVPERTDFTEMRTIDQEPKTKYSGAEVSRPESPQESARPTIGSQDPSLLVSTSPQHELDLLPVPATVPEGGIVSASVQLPVGHLTLKL